ncbi:acyltransferase [Desulfosporosinus sp. SYSU MS00001]|uniref:acyltransferase n=1 Tax=Desulfosporosinus sp. SYSU MS00001 TaxID=3416284 RepID=UPI003CFA1871
MGIAEMIIFLFLILHILNLLFLSLYCRLARILDQRHRAKEEMNQNQINNQQPKKLPLIKRIYSWLEPYFYGWMRYSIIVIGHIPSHRIRNFLYRFVFCMQITTRTVIYGGCEIRSPWNIKAGNCVISTYCILDGRNGIEFGDNVVLGSGVHIWTEEHGLNDPLFGVQNENRAPVVMKSHAWVCSDSTLLPGVIVGEGAVVASRACLTKDAEPFGVYAGIPARKIKERNRDLPYVLTGKPTWHFY